MQILIFTSLNNPQILKEIIEWNRTSKFITVQTFFIQEHKTILSLAKNIKHDLLITTESSVARSLKKAGIKGLLVKKEWYAKTRRLRDV